MPMSPLPLRDLSPRWPALMVAALLSLHPGASPAAEEAEAPPRGAAVTVLKASKFCFGNIVEVSGILLPREETAVRPERFGLKVAEVLADAGDTVSAGQVLARLNLPEGGSVQVQAPIAGMISNSTAVVGATASAKGEALFSIIARSEFDLVGMVPTRDIAKLQINQTARVKIIGAGVNASARAEIKTGQSCGVSVPLTAILYSTAGTVVQVVKRDRVETRRVETGLMSAGQVEIREGIQEGDIVVARAGALLREGDPVRPVMATADAK